MSTSYGHMNMPPKEFVRVQRQDMVGLVASMAAAAGLPGELSDRLAGLLVDNDMIGNFSHGSRQVCTYARLMREGTLNANPQVKTVKESPVSVLVDGDGGLGYFPAYEATRIVNEKAAKSGMAVGVTRNHGHFGAAGNYARMTVGSGLLSYVTSGHQLNLEPGAPLYQAGGGSPMAFGAPSSGEAPLLIDFGTLHDLYAGDGHRDEIASLAPGLVLRCIGLGEVCQVWGGLLSGLAIDPEKRPWSYQGANQGALIVAMRIDLFDDPARFKREVAAYAAKIAELAPLEGFDRSFIAGGKEEHLRSSYLSEGIPVGPEHRKLMEAAAGELGVSVPWSR